MSPNADMESVWGYLKARELEIEVEIEQPPLMKFGWFSIFCSFLQRSASFRLPQELQKEKEILISLAKRAFNHDDPVHVQMLLALFNALTGLHCPSVIGTHWDIIGFQGTDPATDFRGVGMLGLLQPLALAICNAAFMLDAVNLSHSPSQGFPFMVLSLNVTQIVLVSLRDGHLDKLIKEKEAVREVVNLSYGAVLFFIVDHWKKENLTLVDSGVLLKNAEATFRKDPLRCIQQFESYQSSRQQVELQPAGSMTSIASARSLQDIKFHIIEGAPSSPTVATIEHQVLD